ncbi:MAG: hypothetical protein Q9P01_00265 [Anaerolineae bacterium]|nr:hypothetical protein [Anaerolineae bacterium]MDQ7033307.1 hypothetical protein [Anaerolineae bacterium]
MPTTVSVVIPSITPVAAVDTPSTTSLPNNLQDVLPILSGICFEAAWDAAGQVFILRSAEEHIRFYDLADNAGLCRRPVLRHPFDFTQGDILAGLWSRGVGCVARYDIMDYRRDDAAKTVRMALDFITDGDCPYQLVRGFWVSIPNAGDYDITIQVVE